jgi:DNA polymerase-3 subunit beta
MTYWVPGKIDTAALTVPGRLLTDIVGRLPANERVDLELQAQETLHIQAGRFETHVKGIDAEEFPAIPTGRRAADDPRSAERPAPGPRRGDLRRRHRRGRPILTGVLARFEGDKLTLAAADNYRIAVKTMTVLDPSRRRASSFRPGPCTSCRAFCRTRRPGRHRPVAQPKSDPLPSRRHRSGQPADRRPVPQLPAGPAEGLHDQGHVDRDQLLKAVRLASLIASSSANIVKLHVGKEAEIG